MEYGNENQDTAPEIIERLEGVLMDRLAWAKSDTSAIRMKALGLLRSVRKMISSDGPRQDVIKSLFKHNYIPMLMTNAPVMLRFPDATDEALHGDRHQSNNRSGDVCENHPCIVRARGFDFQHLSS